MSINALISGFIKLYTIDGFTFILEVHEADETTQSNAQNHQLMTHWLYETFEMQKLVNTKSLIFP